MALLVAVTALRDRLVEDAAINAFCQERFGRQPRVIRGVRRPDRDQDYPAICVGLLSEEVSASLRTQRLGIAWFVRGAEIEVSEDGRRVDYRGELDCIDLGERIIGAFRSRLQLAAAPRVELGPVVDSLADLFRAHPYYWGETQLDATIYQR